jgi:uncharacterized protein (TIGR03118 family)
MVSSSQFAWRTRVSLLAVAFLVLSSIQGFAQHYTQTDLTADIAATAPAPNLDPNLVNAWGISRSSSSPFWISDNGTGVATLYTGTGAPQSLVVTIPTPDGKGTSTPTGTIWNYSTSFNVAPGKPAIFLFVTEDGTISGWNPEGESFQAGDLQRLRARTNQRRSFSLRHQLQNRTSGDFRR